MVELSKVCGLIALTAGLAGCNHTGAVREEIAQIEQRLTMVEGDITTGMGAVALPGKDVRTRVAYRPFQAWATGFGTKTVTFRQTRGGGDLERQSKRCRPLGGSRPGYRLFIHEDRSTKIDLAAGPLSVEPTDTGLRFHSGFDLWAKTQFAGAGRAPCFGGWSPTVSVGAEVRSRPKTVLELEVAKGSNLNPRYSVTLVSPDRLDLEFRTGIDIPYVGDISIRETFRPKIRDIELMSGELDLLVDDTTELEIPGGETRVYRLGTIDPAVITDRTGIGFETDVTIERQGGGVVPTEE